MGFATVLEATCADGVLFADRDFDGKRWNSKRLESADTAKVQNNVSASRGADTRTKHANSGYLDVADFGRKWINERTQPKHAFIHPLSWRIA